jgi:hypothetical protein
MTADTWVVWAGSSAATLTTVEAVQAPASQPVCHGPARVTFNPPLTA